MKGISERTAPAGLDLAAQAVAADGVASSAQARACVSAPALSDRRTALKQPYRVGPDLAGLVARRWSERRHERRVRCVRHHAQDPPTARGLHRSPVGGGVVRACSTRGHGVMRRSAAPPARRRTTHPAG